MAKEYVIAVMTGFVICGIFVIVLLNEGCVKPQYLPGYQGGYKAGQIDALNGKVHYELNSYTELIWEKIDEPAEKR